MVNDKARRSVIQFEDVSLDNQSSLGFANLF